jgi:hypothetical protein
MKRSDAFPSRWLKESDLYGRPLVLRIKSVEMAELKGNDGGKQHKPAIGFFNHEKKLILNGVNWDTISEIAGDDSDSWVNTDVELFPSKVEMAGKLTPCIRIRQPANATTPPSQPSNRRPVAKAPAGPLPPVEDDLQDQLPFTG